MQTNALYYGDCLDWMQKWDDQSVDLIYLDPPFNSKANYNQLFHTEGGGDAQFRAFNDTWTWDHAAVERLDMYLNATALSAHNAISGLYRILGESGMLSYLTYMAQRLEQCWRLLKDTGSLYLHCDPTASHYLKILMDSICKKRGGGFRNEIIWCYAGGGVPKKDYPRKHDIVLRYSKGNNYTFNVERKAYGEHAKTGRRATDLGETRSVEYHPDGTPVNDWWMDIKPIINWSKERLGYPTQKPEALLEHIIKASSNEGDIVLDPFCGCGTTIAIAEKLNRQFVGVDISSFAIDLVRDKKLKNKDIDIQGIPFDLHSAEKLAHNNAFNFESWAVTRLPGFVPNAKQIGDGGIDGRATLANKPQNWETKLALAQVKSGTFSLGYLRDFMHVINRDRGRTWMLCYTSSSQYVWSKKRNCKRSDSPCR